MNRWILKGRRVVWRVIQRLIWRVIWRRDHLGATPDCPTTRSPTTRRQSRRFTKARGYRRLQSGVAPERVI